MLIDRANEGLMLRRAGGKYTEAFPGERRPGRQESCPVCVVCCVLCVGQLGQVVGTKGRRNDLPGPHATPNIWNY